MKKIINGFRQIFDFAILAKNSNYKFGEKLQIFWVLLTTYLGSKFSKNKREITKNIFDYKVTAYDYDTLLYLIIEIFLSTDYYFDIETDSPKIIDCGANIGMSILFFKKLYPDCSIMAFEPNPYAFELLQKNVQQNNLKNVELHNVGLSNDIGEIDFFINDHKGSLQGSFNKERGGENKIVVKTQKLSELIRDNHFDLIKIDIEGAEIQVIEDLFSKEKIDHFNRYKIEYHHKIGGEKSHLSSFIQQFEKNNFEYNIRTNFSKIGEFQDILLDVYKSRKMSKMV
ncbi:FkbM family methyltransferase [Mangrovivirga cuniculi]|uniref:Methyltransferase FkbM domain-containing protein n=1 Tax=Mangrovivirga cuniculi TaxID=2715131 RepID=A0A4D7JMV6_9BACT|nr:FkbM family methyltransferase [Mangrovivirga cuniculi]QCK16183.1 hypothetical protein DCC35_16250 [Mangrovivirga cuniculi]